MQRIKEGDTVQVISGNDKGARGTVREYQRGKRFGRHRQFAGRDLNNDRVIVSSVNIVKKHQRPISYTRTQTGIIEYEAPIHISNVMLVCPSCDEAVRIGFRYEDDRKVRYCKRCDATVDS
ncbi:MAG: 50S ribosomal protein L24 [Anaerolineae bacterium]